VAISKLPSGKYRAQVIDPATGKTVSAAKVLGLEQATFQTKRDARAAVIQARTQLHGTQRTLTVRQWAHTWTTSPLYQRPKESTNIHNAERIRRFVDAHEHVPLSAVGDEIAAAWIAGGQNVSTVPVLKAMFNDAASATAGRLITRNPWVGLGIKKTRGNRRAKPPAETVVWDLVRAARRLSHPSFAAWLQVAAFTGMRPGELDALRWASVDFAAEQVAVNEQFSATSRSFTLPKNGETRAAILTPPARDALLALPRESAFCFVNARGAHWTAPARAYHWKAARAAVGYEGSLYLATRHFAGAYMTNMLLLPAEDVAVALGHTDGGYLVRTLYGHRDEVAARARVAAAYRSVGNVRPLRAVGGEETA
jgi:integrase